MNRSSHSLHKPLVKWIVRDIPCGLDRGISKIMISKERRIKMKIRGIITALVLFIMFLPSYAAAANLGELRLGLIYGDVQIMTEDTSEWVPAIINMPLRTGDRVWVPEGGRTEIQARNGTAIRLEERSSLDILTVDNESLQFYLDIGRAYLNFRGPKRDRIVQLDTPVSSVRVRDRAKFAVSVSERGDTEISVFKGRVYTEGRSGTTKVTSGKMLYVTDAYAELYPQGRPDAWEGWNFERDGVFEERGYSSRYLPDELDIYAGDLDSNGKWIYTPQYGYVWMPTAHISADWSPYRDGRWVWVGGDYVWIAYEPWGWAPYHYGRWSFVSSVGWCWVPPVKGDVYWGPGYVGWVSTPTYVAWVPLAPEDVYYGYGNYGRQSVNIVNVNINTIEVKNVYRNTHVNKGITIVPRESFLTGRRTDFRVTENPFMKERISIGRPGIEPQRASRIPVMRDIPKAKEPPRTVRETRVPQLRQERRLVREPDKSVFTPGARVKTMPVKSMNTPRAADSGRQSGPAAIDKDRQSRGGEVGIDMKQPAPSAIEKERQSRGVEKGTDVRQKEIRTPEREKRQAVPVTPTVAPAEKNIGQPKATPAPPAEKKDRQSRGVEKGTDVKQGEIRTPEREKRQAVPVTPPVAPAEKNVGQPKATPAPPAEKKDRQPAPSAIEKERQSRGVEKGTDVKQGEIRTPEREKRQAVPVTPPVAPAEKNVGQPKATPAPPAIKKDRQTEQPAAVPERQPRKAEEKTGRDNKSTTGAPVTKGPSEKQDPGVNKQEKKKPSSTQEEEGVEDLKVPERKVR